MPPQRRGAGAGAPHAGGRFPLKQVPFPVAWAAAQAHGANALAPKAGAALFQLRHGSARLSGSTHLPAAERKGAGGPDRSSHSDGNHAFAGAWTRLARRLLGLRRYSE
jgi:hypothetical protein